MTLTVASFFRQLNAIGPLFVHFAKVAVSKKVERGTLLLWNGFAFHVRGFECVQNQVPSTYGKSAQCTKSGPIAFK